MKLNIFFLSIIFIVAFVGLFGLLAFDMAGASLHNFCLATIFSGNECPLNGSLIASVYHMSIFDQLTQSILVFAISLSLFVLVYFVITKFVSSEKLIIERIKSVAIKINWQFRFFRWIWLHEKRDPSLVYRTCYID